MSKHNPVAPVVELKFGGEVYQLQFSFDAIATAEDILNRPLLCGLDNKDYNAPKVSTVRALMFACMLPHRPETTLSEVKKMVKSVDSIKKVWGPVTSAWFQGMALPDPDDVPADPPPGQSEPTSNVG